jgi:polyisoprenoid-binding protein YceI
MRTTIITGAAAIGIIALSALNTGEAPAPHVEIIKVDAKASTLEWTGEKLSGKHTGTVKISGGELKNDHGNLTGSFEIDMTTIENKDLTGEWKTKLENHLKSADFFDVAKYPKATFEITSATPIKHSQTGSNTHLIKGKLTVKGSVSELAFDSKITMEAGKLTAAGTAVVDRSKHDVRYGSKTFFADIGDKMIYDEFTVKINIVAVK